jgi:hypothetical protein
MNLKVRCWAQVSKYNSNFNNTFPVFQIAEDRIQSLYYPSEEAFTLDQESSGVRFLQKPIVSSALEVLTLLQYYETSPGALPKPQVVCPGQSPGKEDEGSEDTESGYEGDDE